MPFIVKRSEINASSLLENLKDTSDIIKSEIAQILKGMTIKFEIKVNDVIFDQHSEDVASQTGDSDKVADKPVDVAANETQLEESSACQATKLDKIDLISDEDDDDDDDEEEEDEIAVDKQLHTVPKTEPHDEEPFRQPTRETVEFALPKYEADIPATSNQNLTGDHNESKTTNTYLTSGGPPQKSPMMIPPQVRLGEREDLLRLGHSNLIRQLDLKLKSPSPQPPRSPTPPTLQRHLPMPKPPIYQIGSQIEACCVSYIDGSSPPTGYITRSNHDLLVINERINEQADRLNAMPGLKSVQVGQLVLAKSNEDNLWYRAKIEGFFGDTVDVDFIDWGMKESISLDRVRKLTMRELTLEEVPPCAVKVYIKETQQDLLREFVKLDGAFNAIVLNYDQQARAYSIMLISQTHV